MDGYRQTNAVALFAINMVATVDPKQPPTPLLSKPSEFTPGNDLQSAMSITRSRSGRSGVSISTERYPSIAS